MPLTPVQEAEAAGFCEFESRLVYTMSSRPAKATQRGYLTDPKPNPNNVVISNTVKLISVNVCRMISLLDSKHGNTQLPESPGKELTSLP